MQFRITQKEFVKIEKEESDIIELVEDKRKKIILNISLMAIYISLLIVSLFII